MGPIALASRIQSSPESVPERTFCISTRASEQSIRNAICSSGISRLTRRIDALGRHTAKADCHLVGDLVWCNGGRDFYPAEHFAAGVPGTFEGRTIQNPIGYHSYLQKLYGDYMQLPPEDQRVMHGFTGWYLDETGETV